MYIILIDERHSDPEIQVSNERLDKLKARLTELWDEWGMNNDEGDKMHIHSMNFGDEDDFGATKMISSYNDWGNGMEWKDF